MATWIESDTTDITSISYTVLPPGGHQLRMSNLPQRSTPRVGKPRPGAGTWRNCYRGRAKPRPNWSKSDWNDWHKEHTVGVIDYHNPYRSEHLIATKQARISHWISAMIFIPTSVSSELNRQVENRDWTGASSKVLFFAGSTKQATKILHGKSNKPSLANFWSQAHCKRSY